MKRFRRLLAFALVFVCFAAFSALSASADNTAFLLYTPNGVLSGIGFSIYYGKGDPVFLCPDLDNKLVAQDDAGTVQYVLERKTSYKGYFGVYEIVDATTNQIAYVPCESPKARESVWINFAVDSQNSPQEVRAYVTDQVQKEDNGTALIVLDNVDSSLSDASDLIPMITINSNGNCVGVVCRVNGTYMLYTEWFDKAGFSAGASPKEADPTEQAKPASVDESASVTSIKLSPKPDAETSGGKSETAVIVAAAVVLLAAAVAAAVFFAAKKKRTEDTWEEESDFDQGKTEYYPVRKLYLACRGGYQEGKLYPIESVVRIGRSETNDIRYPADYPGVSRVHAVVTCKSDAGRRTVWIEDKSSLGTYLKRAGGDGKAHKLQPNTPTELQVGDAFYLAEHANKYELIEK